VGAATHDGAQNQPTLRTVVRLCFDLATEKRSTQPAGGRDDSAVYGESMIFDVARFIAECEAAIATERGHDAVREVLIAAISDPHNCGEM